MKGTLGLKKGYVPFKNDLETTLCTCTYVHTYSIVHTNIHTHTDKVSSLNVQFTRITLSCNDRMHAHSILYCYNIEVICIIFTLRNMFIYNITCNK